MRSDDVSDFESRFKFAILCDFLAGSSIEEISREFRMSDVQIERLLRNALYAYGFESIA